MQPPESQQRFQALAEDELRLALSERTEPLYRMMEYQLGWIDDRGSADPGPRAPRVRATLCLALCDALGGDLAAAAPAAAAVELIHLFSQVHEDIQDGSPNRGNRPTVWWVWGPAQAINAGDGLHALARLSLFRMADRGAPPERVLEATRVLDQACLNLFEGQHMALRFQEQITVTQEAYNRMAERRAGALPACAAELAAIAAAADAGAREACRRCGSRIGVAMQIRADIEGIWGGPEGGDPPLDILSKRKSLPVVYAMEVAPPKVKRELGTLYMQRVLDATSAPRVVELLDGVGARQFCEERVERALEEAVSALSDTPMPDHARGGLAGMAGFAARAGLTA